MLHWGAERCAPQDEPRQKGLCVRTRECVHAGGVWLSEAVGRKWRSGAAVEPGESSQGVAVEMACGAQLGARCGALFLGAENRGRLRRGRTGLYVFTRRRGANTAHIIIVSPKEHPGLGAESARRHSTQGLPPRAVAGRGGRERRAAASLATILPEWYPFIYCLIILGVFMPPPSGFIVVSFSAFFFAHFMQLL